jgi:hypothetical protein
MIQHRPGRGRADAPAGRACHVAAHDPEPQRVPPGRHHRDGRMLGSWRLQNDGQRPRCWRCRARTSRSCASMAMRAAQREGRLSPQGAARPRARSCCRDGFGSLAARRCRRRARSAGHRRRCRLDAVLGAVRAQDAPTAPTCCRKDALKVSIEAGVTLGWERYVGSDGLPSASTVSALRLRRKLCSITSADG